MKKTSSPVPNALPDTIVNSKTKQKEEAPFLKITPLNGRTEWKMSSRVRTRHTDWSGRIHACAPDVYRAIDVIKNAEMRIRDDEYMQNLPFKDECREAYFRFIVPIAQCLNGIGSASPEDAERMKKTALHWVSLILDEAFPPLDLKARRVLGLIRIAHSLCRKLDRLPYKKEVWSEARRQDAKTFTLGEDTEGDLLKKAGLDGLDQARRGKNSPGRLVSGK
jgi:hypothetical protein